MVDSRKLKARMVEKGFSESETASKLGMAQSSLSLKINNGRPFRLTEARELQKFLEIEDADFSTYFFRDG